MSKKYIKDMSREELINVFHANEKLRDDIYEDMVESEMHWISEQMDYLRDGLSSWSIGAHNRNYINVGNADKFIIAVEEVERSIPVLFDEDKSVLTEALEAREEYRNKNVYDDDFDEVEDKMDKLAEELAELITKRFTQNLNHCSNKENQIDYFIDFYSDARIDEDECYIIVEDNDYILYEDSVKSYK